MLIESKPTSPPPPEVLDRLIVLCRERGLSQLAESLADLALLVSDDMAHIADELARLERGDSLAERAADHLLSGGGKRLRPLCVALASRVGRGFDERTLQLAVAVELVHNATLLHDDVVDLAPTRRGATTARQEFGNAASIFGGDWLLVEALRRVLGAGVGDTMERLLDTIEEMIRAESLQLERRGVLHTDEDVYFRIVEGKSAVLFRWGLYSGGQSGGLRDEECEALAGFGENLGVAFQIVDDLLDFTGKSADTGKALFTDLREGKMTYPLILGLSRDPSLEPVLERVIRDLSVGDEVDPMTSATVVRRLRSTGAIDDSRRLAEQRVDAALDCLGRLDNADSDAVRALSMVARSTLHRDR